MTDEAILTAFDHLIAALNRNLLQGFILVDAITGDGGAWFADNERPATDGCYVLRLAAVTRAPRTRTVQNARRVLRLAGAPIEPPRRHFKRNTRYVACDTSEVPTGLRWDVPTANQGQTVEVAYADIGTTCEAGAGSLYRRTTDRSNRSVAYARRDGPEYIEVSRG